jgi:TPR repeat protein
VEKDAISDLLKAAKMGDPRAQRLLGNCYYCGDDVEQNDIEAEKWWCLAAEHGVLNAIDLSIVEGVRDFV